MAAWKAARAKAKAAQAQLKSTAVDAAPPAGQPDNNFEVVIDRGPGMQTMGFELSFKEEKTAFGKGATATVKKVKPDGLAAGKLQVGDRIISVGGVKLIRLPAVQCKALLQVCRGSHENWTGGRWYSNLYVPRMGGQPSSSSLKSFRMLPAHPPLLLLLLSLQILS